MQMVQQLLLIQVGLQYWINDEIVGINLGNEEFKQKMKKIVFS